MAAAITLDPWLAPATLQRIHDGAEIPFPAVIGPAADPIVGVRVQPLLMLCPMGNARDRAAGFGMQVVCNVQMPRHICGIRTRMR